MPDSLGNSPSRPDTSFVISLHYLEALERDDFHSLPAPVFVRGYLRSYAAYIGLDPKRIIGMYQAQMDKFSATQEGSKIFRK